MKVKLRKQPGHNKQYVSYVITIPKEIIERFPEIKKHRFVELETDFIGNIIVKASIR